MGYSIMSLIKSCDNTITVGKTRHTHKTIIPTLPFIGGMGLEFTDEGQDHIS